VVLHLKNMYGSCRNTKKGYGETTFGYLVAGDIQLAVKNEHIAVIAVFSNQNEGLLSFGSKWDHASFLVPLLLFLVCERRSRRGNRGRRRFVGALLLLLHLAHEFGREDADRLPSRLDGGGLARNSTISRARFDCRMGTHAYGRVVDVVVVKRTTLDDDRLLCRGIDGQNGGVRPVVSVVDA
jgi:hypothetical protein